MRAANTSVRAGHVIVVKLASAEVRRVLVSYRRLDLVIGKSIDTIRILAGLRGTFSGELARSNRLVRLMLLH